MLLTVPNSQDFDQSANSTLTKLLEVDSQLAVQEAELLSQLKSVQEKRQSLKTVVSLFTPLDTPATAPISSPAQTSPVKTGRETEPVGFDLAAATLETSKANPTAKSPTETSSEPHSQETKKTVPSTVRRNQTTKFTRPTKATKTASGWQQYVREEFSHISLPSAVSLVLQREAEQVFDIPAVVERIFEDELPAEAESKARRQVTNILSDGARKNKWYRGQLGSYSMSKAAAKAKAS